MDTATFLQRHQVFRLDEAVEALDPAGGRRAVSERLDYARQRGKVRKVARGVYASVPADMDPERFQPDPFLVAAAIRPDAVFSHHAALELLGAAHSQWRHYTAYSESHPRHFSLMDGEVQFIAWPRALVDRGMLTAARRTVFRLDRSLQVTGPEATLIDGFRQPGRVGGLAELIESAAGFSMLDLALLFRLLEAHGQKHLWAALGWFLETYQTTFFVREPDLSYIRDHVPASPRYLIRNQRRGILFRQWNLIVPEELIEGREPDEPEP